MIFCPAPIREWGFLLDKRARACYNKDNNEKEVQHEQDRSFTRI